MSLLHKRDLSGYYGEYPGATANQLIPPRPGRRAGSVVVTSDMALRQSAVWAALRLRADLVSTLPIDCYRRVGGVQIEVPKPPVLVNPGGERVDMQEWLYSTEFDLDRSGNDFGIITERSGFGQGLPARIDLVPCGEVTVRVKDGKLYKYRIGSQEYDPADIWHERQYTVSGLHVGLSPVAYAAWSIGEYLSIQEFALNWFGGGGIPSAILKNSQKTLAPGEARDIKERFKVAVANRDIFVTGGDWEYSMVQADQAGSAWLEAKGYDDTAAARYFNVPSDLIDAAQHAGSSITYANIVSRNLQLLIMNLNPALRRREHALSKLLPQPRYVKFNRGALLEMDPAARTAMLEMQIRSRQMAPSEARELDNRPPYTPEQLAEFDRFWPPKPQPAPSPAPVGG